MNNALNSLVDSQRLRKSVIRRLFTDKLSVAIGELQQNAKRAGAKNVHITTGGTGFRLQDDGHGLRDTAAFHALLQIAATHYDDPMVEPNEEPMGIGVHALLAHSGIAAVTFRSGLLGLTIDTHRWWNDEEYASSWADRMEYHPEVIKGLSIEVTCTPELVRELPTLFNAEHAYHYNLIIWMDGKDVTPTLPAWAQIDEVLVVTQYQNNVLMIGYSRSNSDSCVNWYGQLIKTKLKSCFTYYLMVEHGRPVNPVAPTRASIIEDAALRELHEVVKHALADYLFDPANEATIKPEWIYSYYQLAPARAAQDSPYFIARPWPSGESVGSSDDMDPQAEYVLLRYADQLCLIDSDIMVRQHGDFDPYEYGVPAFVPMTGPAHQLCCGNKERLHIQTIWWQPGAPQPHDTHEPGTWGLGTHDTPPATWQPVTVETVYVFDEANCWDVGEVNFVIGCTDPLAFYQREAWAGFDQHHDDCNYEEIYASYEESCMCRIRQLIGDCVPGNFKIQDIQRHMNDKASRIVTVRYHYTEEKPYPDAITATNEAGQEKHLLLVG